MRVKINQDRGIMLDIKQMGGRVKSLWDELPTTAPNLFVNAC